MDSDYQEEFTRTLPLGEWTTKELLRAISVLEARSHEERNI